ncbi:MAG: DUF1385 domain-containing protein [Desulfatiglandales bacterium]
MLTKMRFSGWSHPWGIFFFGDHYISWAKKKKGKWTYGTRKRPMALQWLTDKIPLRLGHNPVLLSLPFIDLTRYLLARGGNVVSGIVGSGGPLLETLQTKNLIPVFLVFNLIFLILEFYLIFWFIMRSPLKRHHGAEHKAIAAAMDGRLEEAREYSPVHPRCGSNLIPLIIIASWLVGGKLGLDEFLFTSWFAAAMIYIRFPRLMTPARWMGTMFQKTFFVREPREDEIQAGIEALGLLKAKEEANESRGA